MLALLLVLEVMLRVVLGVLAAHILAFLNVADLPVVRVTLGKLDAKGLVATPLKVVDHAVVQVALVVLDAHALALCKVANLAVVRISLGVFGAHVLATSQGNVCISLVIIKSRQNVAKFARNRCSLCTRYIRSKAVVVYAIIAAIIVLQIHPALVEKKVAQKKLNKVDKKLTKVETNILTFVCVPTGGVMQHLPQALIDYILTLLSIRDLASVEAACKGFALADFIWSSAIGELWEKGSPNTLWFLMKVDPYKNGNMFKIGRALTVCPRVREYQIDVLLMYKAILKDNLTLFLRHFRKCPQLFYYPLQCDEWDEDEGATQMQAFTMLDRYGLVYTPSTHLQDNVLKIYRKSPVLQANIYHCYNRDPITEISLAQLLELSLYQTRFDKQMKRPASKIWDHMITHGVLHAPRELAPVARNDVA